MRYFFAGEADGEALGAGVAGAAGSLFFDFFFDSVAPAAVFPPIFTDFASIVPSACFQYDPVTDVSAVISAIVAAAPPFVTLVLSLTLNTRDSFLPAIVNVLALLSTAETVPRNGIARGAFAAGEAALAGADGDVLAPGEAVGVDFLVAAKLELCPSKATAAMQRPAAKGDLSFMVLVGSICRLPRVGRDQLRS